VKKQYTKPEVIEYEELKNITGQLTNGEVQPNGTVVGE